MLTIENLVKTFSGDRARKRNASSETGAPRRIRAVDDVSFEVKEGEMFTLLGPSGCGKTTTLRSVAGLERPDSGVIRVADRVLFSEGKGNRIQVPTNRRGLGMVFQSYAIWPHLKVFDNVAFPLQVMPRDSRPAKGVIREKVMAILETMELSEMANRQATKLSGGQQQRLALARALVTQPELILLDEPLSNLDAKLRESLRFELKRFQRELGITSVYVTHDQVEALALSSRIAVMRDGKIMQIGAPREIYEKPANKFVAEFIGTSNFITGKVVERDGTTLVVDTSEGRLRAQVSEMPPVTAEVILAARPEGITISADAPTGERPNEWTGEVITRSFLGDSVDHLVRVGAHQILVRAHSSVSIGSGTTVTLVIDPDGLSVIPMGD
ncbi:MAG: ABC transporter ATP-binding protein [Acidimicrobiia bacterium]